MSKLITISFSVFLLFAGVVQPQKQKVAPAHTHDILAVKFSPDDTQLISYSWGDGYLILWEAKTGYLIWKTKTEIVQKALERYNLHEFHWSENGEFIVTKSENGTYQTWNAKTGKLTGMFDKAPDIRLQEATAAAVSVTKDFPKFQLVDNATKATFSVEQFSRTGSVYDVSHDNKLFAEGGSWGNAAVKVTEFRSGKSWLLDGRLTRQEYAPSEPGELELRLEKEQAQRRSELAMRRIARDQQAVIDVKNFRKLVYIKFDHYGDMDDPGQKRMAESSEPNKSLVKKSEDSATAVWLRIHNDSPLPIEIPTQSIYMPDPKCFFELANGKRLPGLCDNREISIWHGLEDKRGDAIPYGFDFGSMAILLPKTSAVFPIPRALLTDGRAIHFRVSFQKEGILEPVEKYGEDLSLRFSETDLPKRN